MDQPGIPYDAQVADRVIRALLQGQAPWQAPWAGEHLPFNAVSGRRHKGVAGLVLQMQGRDDPRWLTYRQAQELGGLLKEGERGTRVPYWQFTEMQTKRDRRGRAVLGGDGKPVQVRVALQRPKQYFVTVFNAKQFEGLPELEIKAASWDRIVRAEALLKATGVQLQHTSAARARYDAQHNVLTTAAPSSFTSGDEYYGQLLPALARWAHDPRPSGDRPSPPGTAGHAREELRMAIASALLGHELGLQHRPTPNPATVRAWMKLLREEPREIFRAAAAAEQIVEAVLAVEQQRQQEKGHAAEQQLPSRPLVQGLVAARRWGRRWLLRGRDETSGAEQEPVQQQQDQREAAGAGASAGLSRQTASKPSIVMVAGQDYRGEDGRTYVAAFDDDGRSVAVEVEPPEPRKSPPPLPSARQREVSSSASRPTDQREPAPKPAAGRAAQIDHPQQALGQKKEAAMQRDDGGPSPKHPSYGHPKLAVPYGERMQARAAGAQWDPNAKVWYAKRGADMERLQAWAPETVGAEPAAIDARAELAAVLQSKGFILGDKHPVLDGKPHRCAVEGDSRGSKAGFYVAFADGHPAGYLKNHRTGEELRWKSKGYSLDPQTKARMRAVAAAKRQQHLEATARAHQAAVSRIERELVRLTPLTEPTAYLRSKGVAAGQGLFTDKYGLATYIPLYDVDGKVWSLQTVDPSGSKYYAKAARKNGCFHVAGGAARLPNSEAIVIAEGYATAATLAELLNRPVVAAFDSGNLAPVATALRERYPNKPIIVAADDDRANELNPKIGVNTGVVKAEQAAKLVGGVVVRPIFAPGEQKSDPRGYKDFNDLATKSVLGRDCAQAQVRQVYSATVKAHRLSQSQQRAPQRGRGAIAR